MLKLVLCLSLTIAAFFPTRGYAERYQPPRRANAVMACAVGVTLAAVAWISYVNAVDANTRDQRHSEAKPAFAKEYPQAGGFLAPPAIPVENTLGSHYMEYASYLTKLLKAGDKEKWMAMAQEDAKESASESFDQLREWLERYPNSHLFAFRYSELEERESMPNLGYFRNTTYPLTVRSRAELALYGAGTESPTLFVEFDGLIDWRVERGVDITQIRSYSDVMQFEITNPTEFTSVASKYAAMGRDVSK